MNTKKFLLILFVAVLFSGCAAPYSPYRVAVRNNIQQTQSTDSAVVACQRQLGPPPTIADQAGTTVAGALLGAAGNAAFNAVVGGDPGRGAALGALGGGAIGGGFAAMQPAEYQEALNWCVDQAHQAQAEAYANLPCETRQEGYRENDGRWIWRQSYQCSERTRYPPSPQSDSQPPN